MKTRAAILEDRAAPLRIDEVDLDPPGRGEVLVRVEACGVCRSDLFAIDGGEDLELPAVLGHEAAGIVEASGPAVRGLEEGDHVVLSWTPACGRCRPCRRGRPALCVGVAMSTRGAGGLRWRGRTVDRFMGLGAFCGHVVVPEAMAVPVPSDMPARLSCLLGCAVTTGFGAAVNGARVRCGESVAVLGCGGVGLAAVEGARVAGASRIVAVDPLAARREAALRLGASDALDGSRTVKRLRDLTAGGVDVAIECVGSTVTMREAFEGLRPGGRAIVVGLPGRREMVEIPAILLLGERSIGGSIYGSANPAIDFPRLAELWRCGLLDLDALADRVRPFAEINEALADTRDGRHLRVVVTF